MCLPDIDRTDPSPAGHLPDQHPAPGRQDTRRGQAAEDLRHRRLAVAQQQVPRQPDAGVPGHQALDAGHVVVGEPQVRHRRHLGGVGHGREVPQQRGASAGQF